MNSANLNPIRLVWVGLKTGANKKDKREYYDVITERGFNMFFGPFLPIVPLLVLLEQLPESIGTPIQTVITDGWSGIIIVFREIFGFLFPFLY